MKSAAKKEKKRKKKAGTRLRITKKNFENEEFPQRLLTARHNTKIRTAFSNIMLIDTTW